MITEELNSDVESDFEIFNPSLPTLFQDHLEQILCSIEKNSNQEISSCILDIEKDADYIKISSQINFYPREQDFIIFFKELLKNHETFDCSKLADSDSSEQTKTPEYVPTAEEAEDIREETGDPYLVMQHRSATDIVDSREPEESIDHSVPTVYIDPRMHPPLSNEENN